MIKTIGQDTARPGQGAAGAQVCRGAWGAALRLCAALLACAALSGCAGNRFSPFGEGKDYEVRIAAQDDADHDALQKALDRALENGAAEDFHTEATPQENASRESYEEEKLRADLDKVLRAKGYYEGEVVYVDDPDRALAGTYEARPGPLYRIAAIRVEPENFAASLTPEILAPLAEGAALDAEAVLGAQSRLYEALAQKGCYYTLEVGHYVVLDPAEKTAQLTYTVAAGPDAVFGKTGFTGMETVRPAYLERMVKWKEGDCFNRAKIAALRDRILSSGLFSSAEAALPEDLDMSGESEIPGGAAAPARPVPVTIAVKERAHRSITAGLGYYTSEGLGLNLGWEHRNIFGQAEKLGFDLNVSQLKQSLNAKFDKPYFLREDQSLSANALLRAQETDAYDESGLDSEILVNRKLDRHWTAGLGGGFSLTEIDERGEKTTFGLVSVPGRLAYDGRDNALNPRKGAQAEFKVEPFFDVLGQSDPFTKAQASGAAYLGFGHEKDVVLAVRGLWGSIVGSGNFDIPATERFFAGGGGSVRGFEYQGVGPKEDGKPTGGRAVVTGGAELRVKATDNWGGVLFSDVGTVSETSYPDFQQLAVGAGAGVRYFTGFGPLRFDVAVPVTQREDADPYQIYISIGQAF